MRTGISITLKPVDRHGVAAVKEIEHGLLLRRAPLNEGNVLAARHGLPAIYAARAYAEAGGLLSYGTDILDAFRQVGAI
jgi:hypothetical protein